MEKEMVAQGGKVRLTSDCILRRIVMVGKHLCCDVCDETLLDKAIPFKLSIEMQRKQAKREGWKRVMYEGKMRDVCGACIIDQMLKDY